MDTKFACNFVHMDCLFDCNKNFHWCNLNRYDSIGIGYRNALWLWFPNCCFTLGRIWIRTRRSLQQMSNTYCGFLWFGNLIHFATADLICINYLVLVNWIALFCDIGSNLERNYRGHFCNVSLYKSILVLGQFVFGTVFLLTRAILHRFTSCGWCHF